MRPADLAANLRFDRLTRNDVHALVLLGGIGFLTAFSAWLLWSWIGVLAAVASIGAIYYLAPRLPPEVVMRLYRARPIDPQRGGEIVHIVAELSDRAGLAAAPAVYVIPSMTVNAFATGTREKAAIGVTEGMLRRLGLRELAGVLGHEVNHIANNDLAIMSLADMMTRYTQSLSYLAVFLAIFNLPAMLLGDSDVSLLALALLYLAPTASSLLQLSLARTREFDADAGGAALTGDPAGLASALERVERMQGSFWEDMTMPVPVRRIPVPSVLRTHPPTEQRVERLRALEGAYRGAFDVHDAPVEGVLAGQGPGELTPRFHFPGVWF